ncbi:uncharacterized protein LOC112564862 isoform X2 [Pomacea canaliculata]|uniref:uncharacterized protein LOC112564862 isoform X2 n=1 Tax=Pomacea canaliculata TaxID=400727 RepID=UPI000D7288C2|nr:uncharacterized protein LOC112564862 isoform X2 [Pomacea canaliculata]
MDVTHGLISRLVKSKSTERVLAPIASQVSLLMILSDVGIQEESENEVPSLSMSLCLEKLIRAINGFMAVGEDQIRGSSDMVFKNKMSGACETLELAKSQLFVAGQQVSSMPSSSSAHSVLVRTAKDLLQAVLRVLLVADDVEVRRNVKAIGVVEEKLKKVSNVRRAQDLVPAFKELAEAILYMTMLVSRRQKDLVSRAQGEQLVVGMSMLRKGVSSLGMAVQTFLKYPHNPQALASKDQVITQTLTTLADMREVLESGPPSDMDSEETGHFVEHIDKVLDGLSEANRFDLNPDTEVWVASIVRHAMGVALLCQGTYHHLITHTCQRILQSKFRLFELKEAMKHDPNLGEIRFDYENVCEMLLDEFCEVEKHVNMALLNLIVDTCCFTSQPFELLAKAALHPQDETANLPESSLARDFSFHSEKVCQVATMAAASSMDPKKVRAVKIAVSRLEQLDPEVIPAVMAVAQCSTDVVAVQQLKRLVQEWGQEMELLVQTLDSMTDPAIFINVTEQRIRQSINVIRGCLSERDIPGLKYSLRKLLAHARHMIQVATQVVDHHFDPIFRNGLLVFIQRMTQARRGLKEAGQAILEDLTHPRLADTLQRRMNLLVDTTSDLRQGLKGDNHVDVLNPARENVRNRPHHVSKVVTGKKRSESDVLPARSKEHASQPKPLKPVQEPMMSNVNKESMMSSQAAIPAMSTSSIAAPRTCTALHTTSTVFPAASTVVPATSTSVPTASIVVPANSTSVPAASTVVPATSTVVPTAFSVVPATSTFVPTAFTSVTMASTPTCMAAVLNGAVVANPDNIYYTSQPTLQKTGNKVKDMDAQLTVSSSTNVLTKQQKGEVSRLVQVCGNGLVSAAVAGDATALAERNGDMLGWTAHLVETALCLLDHCHHVSWQREMQELTVTLDRLAPQVIEMARFVLAGDMGQSDALKELVDSWMDVCNRLRIVIDVATGDWLVLMEQVIQTVSAKDPTSLKHLLGQVDSNFREMKQLLRKAQKLEGCHVPAGAQIIQFLSNTQSELENVTATLKTAADCMATSSTSAGDKNAIMRTQLVQWGREWCTLMTCVVAEFDYMADILIHTGQSILGIPATVGISSPVSSSSRIFSSCDNKVAALIETETIRLKDMLTCLSSSDSGTRKRCEELKESLSEIMKEVTEIVQNPIDSILPQAQLFARLDAGMARSHWTEKALETEQLIRRYCLKFSAPVNNLLILATATSTSGTHKEAVQTEASALADKLKNATQKVLQAIQLSSELPQRATVRRCLDDLNILLAMITESAALCASEAGSRPKSKETELYKAGFSGEPRYTISSVFFAA